MAPTSPAGRVQAFLTVEGIDLAADYDEVLDLLVDGRRVWSFRAREQAVREGRTWHVAWPRDLVGHLDGDGVLAVRDAAGEVVVETPLSFGDVRRPLSVADASGQALVIGANGRLVRTFETRTAAQLDPLLDALERVIAALAEAGVAAFPAYGTLLGAVREGRVIGHDDDADVGYLSTCTHPADAMLESYRLQRALHREGFTISRYSGAAFKVEVPGVDGAAPVGLDVFAGFFYGSRLVLMGEIFEEFELDWILPLGEVELEGRRLPAPAHPERLLAAMYGPTWRVPDPTFRFETSQGVRDRLDGWFRGTRTYRNLWDRRYSTSAGHGPWHREPHRLAKVLNRTEQRGTTIVDVGCGRGQDAVWLANRGHHVVALDFSGNGFAHLARRAAEESWDVEFGQLNLLEQRSVLAWGATLALHPGPRAVLARHVLDATTPRGREGFWRLARMVLGDPTVGGGRLHLDVMSSGGPGAAPIVFPDGLVHEVDPDELAAEAEDAGGRVVARTTHAPSGYELPSPPAPGSPAPRSTRMVVEWAP